MAIGFGEMALDKTVLAVVFDDERKMRGEVRRRSIACAQRSEENGERVLAHGFEKDGAIGDLVEFGCVHGIGFRCADEAASRSFCRWGALWL